MKPVSIDEFCSLKFFSNVTFSPDGQDIYALISEADMKADGYSTYICRAEKNGKVKKLTSFGRERNFRFTDKDTVLFISSRKKTKDGYSGTKFYTLDTGDGRVKEKYDIPVPVSNYDILPDGNLIMTAKVFRGYEDLYLGDRKYAESFRKDRKEISDYEVMSESPWWMNGSGHTRGEYNALFMLDTESEKLTKLTAAGVRVLEFCGDVSGKYVYFLGSEWKDCQTCKMENRLYRTNLETLETEIVLEPSKGFEINDIYAAGSYLLVVAAKQPYGYSAPAIFYKLDYGTLELTQYAKISTECYNEVCTDVLYGQSPQIKVKGDTVYFITTCDEYAYLEKLEDGKVSKVTAKEGAVDSFDVYGDSIAVSALYRNMPQEIYDGKGNAVTKVNAKAVKDRYVGKPESLVSHGRLHNVKGFVIKPLGYEEGEKYPVILDVHGGPAAVYSPVFFHEMQYWAGKGFFVIFCNPTGSSGRGEKYMNIRGKYGSEDFEDIMKFCDDALAAYPSIDSERMFVTGGSYGGFMTNWIIGHTDRFKAAATQRSISNWISMYGVSDIGVYFCRDENGADPWTDEQKMWEQSPLKYADRIKTPTLVLHSDSDYRCPVDQGYQMFTALKVHGVDSRLVIFKGENHELSRSGKPSHRIRRLDEITKWFEKHMQ